MNDQENKTAPESEEPVAAVSEDLAGDINHLADRVAHMERVASRGWKITLVFFIVLLAVIAGYMYFWIYRGLKDTLAPDTLIEMMKAQVNPVLQQNDLPALDNIHLLPRRAADRAIAMAPDLVQNRAKPLVEDLIAQLPEHRQQLVQQIRSEASRWSDELLTRARSEYLPDARRKVRSMVRQKLEEGLAEADARLSEAVGQIVEEQDFKTLTQQGNIEQAFQTAFEERLGPYLDEMVLEKLDVHINNAVDSLNELVNSPNRDYKSKLEIRIIQLVRALFENAAQAEVQSTSPGVTTVGIPAGVPPEEAQQVREAIRQGLIPNATVTEWTVPENLSPQEKATLKEAIEQGKVPKPTSGMERLED